MRPNHQTILAQQASAAPELRNAINVSGTMTWLGASIVVPEAVAAVSAALPQFFVIDDLQRQASAVIAQACGGEAGCITASTSAAVTLSIAAAMVGCDLVQVERLPDTQGLKNEVLLQAGHNIHYGAPLDQAIRLAGARVVTVGQSTSANVAQLLGAITERTCAALYVVSHHAVQYGQLPLGVFIEHCHARGVPVIVDAASEYDLRRFIAAGADLALYSAHKFLGGPTAGIVAGRRELVRAVYAQNHGIGRGMKVGKEGILGTIAALQAWGTRDHAGVRAREAAHLSLWQSALLGFAGVGSAVEADPTGNPLDRLRVTLNADTAGISAWSLAHALASGDPAIFVRDHEIEHGYFYLDPCNLHPGQEQLVAARLRELLAAARTGAVEEIPLAELQARKLAAQAGWPLAAKEPRCQTRIAAP